MPLNIKKVHLSPETSKPIAMGHNDQNAIILSSSIIKTNYAKIGQK
jgi:hypothetical protein